jgi:hypothetical protein
VRVLPLAIAVNALASISSLLRHVDPLTQWTSRAPDAATLRDRTLAPLMPLLARERRIGYRTTIPNDQLMSSGSAAETERYFLAQYALVPVVLARLAPDPPLLLLDLPSESELARHLASCHCRALWRHNGLALVEGSSR